MASVPHQADTQGDAAEHAKVDTMRLVLPLLFLSGVELFVLLPVVLSSNPTLKTERDIKIRAKASIPFVLGGLVLLECVDYTPNPPTLIGNPSQGVLIGIGVITLLVSTVPAIMTPWNARLRTEDAMRWASLGGLAAATLALAIGLISLLVAIDVPGAFPTVAALVLLATAAILAGQAAVHKAWKLDMLPMPVAFALLPLMGLPSLAILGTQLTIS